MGYGDFDRICAEFPQPICNLFFRQLLVHPATGTGSAPDPALGTSLDVKDAGLGVNPECTIARMSAAGGAPGSVGNVGEHSSG